MNEKNNHSPVYGPKLPTVYIVQWCNHEGNLQQKCFDRLEDAELDAEYLKTRFDYVVIIAEMKV